MSHPETGAERPDAAPHFEQLLSYADVAHNLERDALITYIQSNTGLNQLLQNYLREGYDLPVAIGMVGQAIAPENEEEEESHPFDSVQAAEREIAEMQLHEALGATGLQFNAIGAPTVSLHVQDMTAFANALSNLQTPQDTAAQERLRNGIGDIIEDTLYRSAIAIRRDDKDTYSRLRGGENPSILQTLGFTPEQIDNIDAEADPGKPFADTLARRAPEILARLEALGGNSQTTQTLRQLQAASADGLEVAWAAAYDLDIFSAGRVGAERMTTEDEWDVVLDFLENLHSAAPRAGFTARVREQLLDDISAELNRPFDPDDPAEVGLPSAPMGQPLQTGEDQLYEELDDTARELQQMELELLGELHIVDEAGAELHLPEGTETNHTPEQARLERIQQRRQLQRMLEDARGQIKAVMPMNPARASETSITSEVASGTIHTSVADVAAAVLSQEIVLQETEQLLAGQRETLVDVHRRLSALFEGTNSPDALLALSGLAEACKHINNFLASSTAALRHLRRYQL